MCGTVLLGFFFGIIAFSSLMRYADLYDCKIDYRKWYIFIHATAAREDL
jgi:hypothetical protein